MKKFTRAFSKTVCLFFLATFLFVLGCRKSNEHRQELKDFDQVNLVDNNGEYHAANLDASLMNAWGLAFSPGGIAWVNSQAGHVSELYSGEGIKPRAAVNIPSPGDSIGGNPTGIVFNSTKDFILSNNAAAAFIFVGVDGVLSAWNGAAGNNAFRIHAVPGASFTGLALASSGGANYLYAANFAAGKNKCVGQNFRTG